MEPLLGRLHLLDHHLEFTCRRKEKKTLNSSGDSFFVTNFRLNSPEFSCPSPDVCPDNLSDSQTDNSWKIQDWAVVFRSQRAVRMFHENTHLHFDVRRKRWDCPWRWKQVLLAGMMDTSAVTMLLTPRLSRAPLTRPQVKARYCRHTQAECSTFTHSTLRKHKAADVCTGVPSGPDPDTVFLLTVDSVTETCCPGGRRCPETSTTPSDRFRDNNLREFMRRLSVIYRSSRSQTEYGHICWLSNNNICLGEPSEQIQADVAVKSVTVEPASVTWWLVRRLSICFLNTHVQKSLQMNFITSSSSLNRAVSLVSLRDRSSHLKLQTSVPTAAHHCS